MKLRTITSTAFLALALMLAARPALADSEIGYFNDFQQSLDKFVPASADNKCVSDKTLRLSFERDTIPRKSNVLPRFNGFADLANTCGAPVWMMANLTGTGDKLDVEFDAKDLEACGGCIPLVYAGVDAPRNISQFTTDYKGLGAKWERHTLVVSVAPSIALATDAQSASTIVAISFTNLDDKMPTLRRIGIDNLSVTLHHEIAPPPPAND